MARNRITTRASPQEVFAILADPACYPKWVVGTSELRGADEDWPRQGTSFHHTEFLPRIGLRDSTTVLECDPPGRLVLRTRVRPLLVAEVELLLRELPGGGTEIEMNDEPVGSILGVLDNPLLQLGLKMRNAESLRRLSRLAEERQAGAPE